MNQIVQEADIVSAVPIPMTRKEKLLHWAKLVRNSTSALHLFHLLERWNADQLNARGIDGGAISAFSVAASDPTFQAQGYKGETVRQAMDFFELSQQQLHEFSCDCGGHISNSGMADRIEHLA